MAKQVHRTRQPAGVPLVILAHVHQHRAAVASALGVVFGNVDLAHVPARLLDQGEEAR